MSKSGPTLAAPATAKPSKSAKSSPTTMSKAGPGKVAKPKMHFAAPTGGRSLDHATRKTMERGYRQNFSDVRIFTDNRAGALADGLGAKAVTIDRNVYFGPGRYSPTTSEGKRTIAHELAHVAHNRQSRLKHPGVAPETARSEVMAERAADRVLTGENAPAFNFRDWGPTWDAQRAVKRISSRGTVQHTGGVQGPIPFREGINVGDVEVRTGEEVELSSGSKIPNVISIEYSGGLSADHRWLQFVWFELETITPKGSTRRSGNIATTSGTKPFTNNPASPNWSVDSASTSDPFYEARGINIRNSSSTTIFDKPGGASVRPLANSEFASNKAATKVVFRAHFETYLIQYDTAAYVVRYTAATAFSKSGGTVTGGTVGYTVGTSGQSTGLPTNLRNILHTAYTSHKHIT